MLFQTHHVAFDAWAVEIFFRELARAYEVFLEGGRPHLAPLPLQYRDFAHWQRDVLHGRPARARDRFPRRYLAAAPTFLALPADRPRLDVELFEAGRHTIELPRDVADDLRALCAAEGATPYMFLLAASATLLYRETGQDEHPRRRAGGEPRPRGVRGPHRVLREHPSSRVSSSPGNPTLRELLARVRSTVLEALEHQGAPVRARGRTGSAAPPEGRQSALPGELPHARRAAADAGAGRREHRVRFRSRSGLARFDLAGEAQVRDDGIGGEFLHATALFDRARVERLAAAFEALLEDALADPSRRLLGFELPAEPVALQSGAPDPRRPETAAGLGRLTATGSRSPASIGTTAPVTAAPPRRRRAR